MQACLLLLRIRFASGLAANRMLPGSKVYRGFTSCARRPCSEPFDLVTKLYLDLARSCLYGICYEIQIANSLHQLVFMS